MYPSNAIQKNLHFPESGLNFSLNIFLYKSKFINLLQPWEYDTSINNELLNHLDKSESKAQISFIPIDFLRKYIKEKNIEVKILFTNELEEKKYYIDLFTKNRIFNKDFFEDNTYKDVPLKYLRKSYLPSLLTKTIDVCKLQDSNELNNIIKIKTINVNDVILKNEDEWLSNIDIISIIYPKIYSLPKEKQDLVSFLPFIRLKKTSYNINFTYSQCLHDFDWDSVDRSKRFIIFFILYRSHFTSVIIDRDVNINYNRKKVAFLFNSSGYNPNNFNLNKDYWFIDNSCKIYNHKVVQTSYFDDMNGMIPIEALNLILKNKFGVTNFMFNTFCIQNFNSECGIFSSMFLYFFIDLLANRSEDSITIMDFKYIYFNLLTLGCDLTYSMFRGLLFFTNEDLKYNKIDETIYNSSPEIYKITNRKFKDYIKIYFKNLNFIENILNDIKKEKNYLNSLV